MNSKRATILFPLLLFPFSALLRAEKPDLGTILYGASYYHEYMPYERLDKDVELMKAAGLSVIRLGESVLLAIGTCVPGI